jgi:hypothetical protein
MYIRHPELMILAFALALVPRYALADVCTVPGTHVSIQAAVDDPACADIELANQNYFELLEIDRSLSLSGAMGGSATVVGQIEVTGSTTLAMLSDFHVEGGCPEGVLRVTGGSQATASWLQVVYDAGSDCVVNLIFRDGFEN